MQHSRWNKRYIWMCMSRLLGVIKTEPNFDAHLREQVRVHHEKGCRKHFLDNNQREICVWVERLLHYLMLLNYYSPKISSFLQSREPFTTANHQCHSQAALDCLDQFYMKLIWICCLFSLSLFHMLFFLSHHFIYISYIYLYFSFPSISLFIYLCLSYSTYTSRSCSFYLLLFHSISFLSYSSLTLCITLVCSLVVSSQLYL